MQLSKKIAEFYPQIDIVIARCSVHSFNCGAGAGGGRGSTQNPRPCATLFPHPKVHPPTIKQGCRTPQCLFLCRTVLQVPPVQQMAVFCTAENLGAGSRGIV